MGLPTTALGLQLQPKSRVALGMDNLHEGGIPFVFNRFDNSNQQLNDDMRICGNKQCSEPEHTDSLNFTDGRPHVLDRWCADRSVEGSDQWTRDFNWMGGEMNFSIGDCGPSPQPLFDEWPLWGRLFRQAFRRFLFERLHYPGCSCSRIRFFDASDAQSLSGPGQDSRYWLSACFRAVWNHNNHWGNGFSKGIHKQLGHVYSLCCFDAVAVPMGQYLQGYCESSFDQFLQCKPLWGHRVQDADSIGLFGVFQVGEVRKTPFWNPAWRFRLKFFGDRSQLLRIHVVHRSGSYHHHRSSIPFELHVCTGSQDSLKHGVDRWSNRKSFEQHLPHLNLLFSSVGSPSDTLGYKLVQRFLGRRYSFSRSRLSLSVCRSRSDDRHDHCCVQGRGRRYHIVFMYIFKGKHHLAIECHGFLEKGFSWNHTGLRLPPGRRPPCPRPLVCQLPMGGT